MAQSRRKQRIEPEVPAKEPAESDDPEAPESLGAIPELMRRAIALAAKGRFAVEPNPLVRLQKKRDTATWDTATSRPKLL